MKSYSFILSQATEDDPDAIVIQNQLSGVPVWTRLSKGKFVGTLSDGFVGDIIFPQNNIVYSSATTGELYRVACSQMDNHSILVETIDISGPNTAYIDEALSNTFLQVLVPEITN